MPDTEGGRHDTQAITRIIHDQLDPLHETTLYDSNPDTRYRSALATAAIYLIGQGSTTNLNTPALEAYRQSTPAISTPCGELLLPNLSPRRSVDTLPTIVNETAVALAYTAVRNPDISYDAVRAAATKTYGNHAARALFRQMYPKEYKRASQLPLGDPQCAAPRKLHHLYEAWVPRERIAEKSRVENDSRNHALARAALVWCATPTGEKALRERRLEAITNDYSDTGIDLFDRDNLFKKTAPGVMASLSSISRAAAAENGDARRASGRR